MHKLIALGLVFGSVAVGCASGMKPVKGPDGQQWVAITCEQSASKCWQKAGEFCPGGYEMADEVQSKTGGFLFFGHHMKDEMLIRCKAPTQAASNDVTHPPATEKTE